MRSSDNETAGDACDIPAAEQSAQAETTLDEAEVQADEASAQVALEGPGAREPKLVADFLRMKFPPRPYLLHPIIQRQSIGMLYAWRGIGKTMLALNVACAMAAGTSFHTWKANAPVKVLYLDGEMAAADMQKRFEATLKSGNYPGAEGNIYLVTPDAFLGRMLNLSEADDQKEVLGMALTRGIDVIIIDNISTLTSGHKENEADSWVPLQQFALAAKRYGIAVFFVHHASKNGAQRGTSKREDVMDVVIRLKRPDDYEASQGARFNVEYEKARSLTGSDAEGFEANLLTTGEWDFKSLDDLRVQQVQELQADGMSIREIAQQLGLSRSTVQRLSKVVPGAD